MIRLRKLINAFPIVALLAFPSGISAAAGATPEQLIASFSDAPNPDAVFYAINKASGTDPAPVRKAALAHIGDSGSGTRFQFTTGACHWRRNSRCISNVRPSRRALGRSSG